jgi:site-specific DNA-methyltransferase (adenine-specific)
MNFLKKNLNKIICSDSIIGLNKIEDNSIDMVITSPPYDQLRDYEKKAFDLDGTGEEIFRVLKNGSICAVVFKIKLKTLVRV